MVKPNIYGFNDLTISQDVTTDMYLTCNASGNPTPDITWQHNGKEFNSTKSLSGIHKCADRTSGIYHNQLNQLIICKIDFAKHEGSFECIASNKVNTSRKSMNLTIEVCSSAHH